MGRVVDGQWLTHDLGPDEHGRYVRCETWGRGRITKDGSSGFAATAGRYHLYVSHACGWSHRVLLFRALLGLQDAIPLSCVDAFMGEDGWTMATGVDPIHGASKLYEVYLAAKRDYTGRASVPVLWDRQTSTIVSNESADMARFLDAEFGALTGSSHRFFPSSPSSEIDAMIDANYGPVNNGVYKAGFARSQTAHAEAVNELFARLDELEVVLGRTRFLVGEELSAADLFLFPTIYRFDSVYYVHFKCCVRQIRDYPNLWGWARDIYQQPGVADTCNMKVCTEHYYTSHESIHPRRYVPLGPHVDFSTPHGRGAAGR